MNLQSVLVDMEPRILAGPAQLVVGGLLLTIAFRLWLVAPVNRVFRVGPYVTEQGFRALLRLRLTVFAFGCTLTSGGLNRMAYWFMAHDVFNPVVVFFGSLEAALAVWAATLAIMAAVRLWRAQ